MIISTPRGNDVDETLSKKAARIIFESRSLSKEQICFSIKKAVAASQTQHLFQLMLSTEYEGQTLEELSAYEILDVWVAVKGWWELEELQAAGQPKVASGQDGTVIRPERWNR